MPALDAERYLGELEQEGSAWATSIIETGCMAALDTERYPGELE